jgi:hypothetical protein
MVICATAYLQARVINLAAIASQTDYALPLQQAALIHVRDREDRFRQNRAGFADYMRVPGGLRRYIRDFPGAVVESLTSFIVGRGGFMLAVVLLLAVLWVRYQ